jgi:hypothetical protein
MEFVGVLRVLQRHRLLVALGVLAAVAAGAGFLLQGDRTTETAAARLLIRAPASPTVNLDTEAARTLANRVSLLADLMATDGARAVTARGAGVRPDELAVSTPAMTVMPTVAVPIAVGARQAALVTPEPYMLSVESETGVPILVLRATAPDAAAATRLVDAGTRSLQALIARRAPSAASVLEVERLEPLGARTLVSAPRRSVAVLIAAFVFCMWCLGMVIASGVARSRRKQGPRARVGQSMQTEGSGSWA